MSIMLSKSYPIWSYKQPSEFYFHNRNRKLLCFAVTLTLALQSSSAAEQERVAANESAAAFSIKKQKLRLNERGPKTAAVRHDLGRPWTMINFRLRLVSTGCFDDKRVIEHL